jgi:hypothetical protein
MSVELEHVAHPRLYGAPAYARPPLSVTPTALPIDPDDLPIAAEQTPEEQAIAERLLASPYRVAERPSPTKSEAQPQLRPQPLLLGVLADRILRRAS